MSNDFIWADEARQTNIHFIEPGGFGAQKVQRPVSGQAGNLSQGFPGQGMDQRVGHGSSLFTGYPVVVDMAPVAGR
jgi:hypothetical protein